jgi:hypothetical protein
VLGAFNRRCPKPEQRGLAMQARHQRRFWAHFALAPEAFVNKQCSAPREQFDALILQHGGFS